VSHSPFASLRWRPRSAANFTKVIDMYSGGSLGRLVVRHALLVVAVVSLCASFVFGRAGYYRAPAGGGRYGMHVKMGEPNHFLGAARLPGGPVIQRSSRGGSFSGEAGEGGAMLSGMGSPGGTPFSSTWHATQAAPYESDARYQPPYYHNYHSYGLHGYWGGGLWGWGRWCGDLGIWRLARWSMGPIYYPSGYGLFQNPFLEGTPALTAADRLYALPIRITPDDLAGSSTTGEPAREKNVATLRNARKDLLRSPQEKAALEKFDLSRDAFRKGDYDAALEQVEAALAILPDDAALHQYRALILFARADYRRAAIALYAVIAVSPGFDWTTLSGFYAEHASYTAQLRKLEVYHKANPAAAEAAFLLSYHYLSCRHFESALRQMQAVGRLLPNDALVPELIDFLKNAVEFEAQPLASGPELPDEPSAEEQPAPADSAPAVAPELAGEWIAKRGKDIQIDLSLTAEGQFHWTATERGTQHEFAGEYATEGDRIILAGPHGTVLARWKQASPGRFNFKLLENDPVDAGLDFVKTK